MRSVRESARDAKKSRATTCRDGKCIESLRACSAMERGAGRLLRRSACGCSSGGPQAKGLSDLELAQQTIQLIGEFAKALTSFTGLLGSQGAFLRQPGRLGHVLVDVLDHVGLL